VLQIELCQVIYLHLCGPTKVSIKGILAKGYDFGAVDAADVVEPGLYARVGGGGIGEHAENVVPCPSVARQHCLFVPQSFCSAADDCSFPMVMVNHRRV
jgi:hypothetical protein